MTDAATRPLPSPIRRVLRLLALAALVLLPLAGAAAYLALQPPAWWHPGSRDDAAAAERAAAFEQAIVAAFTRVRGDQPEWAIRIQASEVNDWLATRLPAWLESRGEPVPVAVQACMVPGRLPIAFVGLGLDARWRDSGLESPIRLADGRLVRVLDVELLQDELRLRLRTEPRPAGR